MLLTELTPGAVLAAMHPCMCIPEIVETVAEFLEMDWDSNPNLMAMALSCHGFYSPARAPIWRDIEGLTCLMKCFPESVWNSEDKSTASNDSLLVVIQI